MNLPEIGSIVGVGLTMFVVLAGRLSVVIVPLAISRT